MEQKTTPPLPGADEKTRKIEALAWSLYLRDHPGSSQNAFGDLIPATQSAYLGRARAESTKCYKSSADLATVCMAEAYVFAQFRSKDPNTKVGACVYDPVTGGLFLGYNGFPTGVPDLQIIWDNRDASDPDCKYNRVVHAEANAVRKAMQAVGQLDNCTLYVTHFPCRACMKDFIIPSGLKAVTYLTDQHRDEVSITLADHAGVTMTKASNQMARDMFNVLHEAAARLMNK